MNPRDPSGFPFEAAIETSARAFGLQLAEGSARRMAAHARLVLQESTRLHLTAITDPEEFVARHIDESLEGAALLGDDSTGTLLDLGSGNGYPGLPISVVRSRLRLVLAESSAKKAEFLRHALAAAEIHDGKVLETNVRHARDLALVGPIDVLVTRAMGGWEKLLPKLATAIRPGGIVLIWAGAEAARIVGRASWSTFALAETHPLRGRDSSWIYQLRRISN